MTTHDDPAHPSSVTAVPQAVETVGPVVVAVTTEDDRYPRSRQIAMELARHADARLVLYDWDAATVLGDPNPTVWSADGPDREAPSELGVAALEAAGRDAIAGQVAEARRRGVEAAAWLPSEPGAAGTTVLIWTDRAGNPGERPDSDPMGTAIGVGLVIPVRNEPPLGIRTSDNAEIKNGFFETTNQTES